LGVQKVARLGRAQRAEPQFRETAFQTCGRRVTTRRQDHRDRPGIQAVGSEGEHVVRSPVDPLGVVDDSHQAQARVSTAGQQVQQAE
jgi:hypothetical protein